MPAPSPTSGSPRPAHKFPARSRGPRAGDRSAKRPAPLGARAAASATHSTRIPRRPPPGSRSGRTALRSPSRRWPRTDFWGAALLEQLGRTPMHRQLRFQLADPPLGRGELRLLQRAQPGFEPAVDLLLAAPAIDRLLADAQVARHVRHLPPGGQQVDHPPSKLRRISTSAGYPSSAHAALPFEWLAYQDRFPTP